MPAALSPSHECAVLFSFHEITFREHHVKITKNKLTKLLLLCFDQLSISTFYPEGNHVANVLCLMMKDARDSVSKGTEKSQHMPLGCSKNTCKVKRLAWKETMKSLVNHVKGFKQFS